MKALPAKIPSYLQYGLSETPFIGFYFQIKRMEPLMQASNYIHQPHRHQHLFQLVYITEGDHLITIDTRDYPLSAGTLFLIPPGLVHGSVFSPSLRGFVVHFSADFFEVYARVNFHYDDLDKLFNGPSPVIVSLPANQTDLIRNHLLHMEQEVARNRHVKDDIIRSCLNIVLVIMYENFIEQTDQTGTTWEHSSFVHQFRKLVEQDFVAHKQVKYYADQLHVTPDHLNDRVREQLGITASTVITQRVIAEATRRLIFTDEQVSEISFDLGYDGAPYFWRLFKKQTGYAPGEFRKNYFRHSAGLP